MPLNYRILKLIVLVALSVFLLKPNQAAASHAMGGEISYEYIGDSTGNAREYLVRLTLYRRVAGIPYGNTMPITISSSCYSNQTVTLTPDGVLDVPLSNFEECLDSVSPTPFVSLYSYVGSAILPGLCSDFRFAFSQCCRNLGVTNLNTSSSSNMYIESLLNNFHGPNSSPKFVSEGCKSFCVNQKARWSMQATERDQDSLYYEVIQPLDNATTPIPWASGFSTSNPISSTNGLQFNSSNGDMSFTPSGADVNVMRVRVNEYRFDTIFGFQVKIGHVDRELQVIFVLNCPVLQTSFTLRKTDTLSIDSTALDCGQKFIHLEVPKRIVCNSIASDGSDFLLYNSFGNLIPIIKAGTDSCQTNLYTKSFWLELNDSIYFNDSLQLVSRVGNDLNTLVNACGIEMAEFDSIPFMVNTCTTSIKLEESSIHEITIYPNPTEGLLHIETVPGPTREYTILNTSGSVVMSGILPSHSAVIDVYALTTGLYILSIDDEHGPINRRFEKL